MSAPAPTQRRRRARCTTCLAPLARSSCPKHGPRNPDGSSLKPSPNKGRRFPAEPLTREEVAGLLRACSHRSPTGIRNAAIVATLWRSGIRCSEMLDLRPKDIDRKDGLLRVLHGKGDKSRSPAIDDDAIARIDRWLDTRGELGINNHRPLFCTLHGGRLSSRYIRELIPRLGERAGIEKRCHAHGLRHSLAYELAMADLPIPVIQAQLGHSSAAVTARYIEHVAPKHVVDAVRGLPGWDGTE